MCIQWCLTLLENDIYFQCSVLNMISNNIFPDLRPEMSSLFMKFVYEKFYEMARGGFQYYWPLFCAVTIGSKWDKHAKISHFCHHIGKSSPSKIGHKANTCLMCWKSVFQVDGGTPRITWSGRYITIVRNYSCPSISAGGWPWQNTRDSLRESPLKEDGNFFREGFPSAWTHKAI